MLQKILIIAVIVGFLLILFLRYAGKKPWGDKIPDSDTSKRTFLLLGIIIMLLIIKLVREW